MGDKSVPALLLCPRLLVHMENQQQRETRREYQQEEEVGDTLLWDQAGEALSSRGFHGWIQQVGTKSHGLTTHSSRSHIAITIARCQQHPDPVSHPRG